MSLADPVTNLTSLLSERGIVIGRDGNRLIWEGPKGSMTPDLLEALKVRKWELLAIMAIDNIADPDTRSDARYRFEEWAGIQEFTNGMDRIDAEHDAFELIQCYIPQGVQS